ncbi:MAG: Asp-tRNA(Asn)/Glu-tRNA(Gln) amidotransferase subunit GatC [Candidatus Aminicenantia bacterium]
MKFDIEKILKLSMIEVDEDEKTRLKEEMGKILQWISKLEEVTIEGEGFSFLTHIPLRDDEPKVSLHRDEVISSTEGNGVFFVVPKVVEK